MLGIASVGESSEFDPAQAEAEAKQKRLRFFTPLDEAIHDPPVPTFPFGLAEIDRALGGGLAQGLHLMIGYSHAGKSLVVEQAVANNPDKVVAIVTPDETVDMVVAKLMEMTGADPNAPLDQRRSWARENFPNLNIQADVFETMKLEAYLEEVKFVLGRIDAIVFDYLDLLRGPGVGDDVKSKSEYLKAIAKEHHCPLICIHQGSRGRSADGQALTLAAGAYGGEQAAYTVLGVYQRAFNPDLPPTQRAFYEQHPQLTVQVLKNKQVRGGGLRLELSLIHI